MKGLKLIKIAVIAGVTVCNVLAANAQIKGCNDSKAQNYNALATHNDGGCVYNAVSAMPENPIELPAVLKETSGLIYFNAKLWSHNDDTDNKLYAFDPLNPTVYQAYMLTGVVNKEWEDIAQDKDYVYVGDVGNNASGNRTDLKILRVSKSSLLQNSPVVETIRFSYDRQTDFAAKEPNKTDFDCEAFVVAGDSIYLFTKEWLSHKTSIYALPKTAGNYSAKYRGSYQVDGLITGATCLEDKSLVALCGYSESLQPFVVLLYDFEKNNFLSANKRKIQLDLIYHQVEGISTTDGLNYYISNEKISYSYFTVPPKIHSLNLSAFLSDYLDKKTGLQSVYQYTTDFKVYPNPVHDILKFDFSEPSAKTVSVFNMPGQFMGAFTAQNGYLSIPVTNFSNGMYHFKINNPTKNTCTGSFLIMK